MAIGGYTFDPTKLSDQELNAYLQNFRTGAARDNPNNPTSKITLDLISRIEEEMNKRETQKQIGNQRTELEAILGQGLQGAPRIEDERSRRILDDIFNVGRTSGQTAIDEAFARERGSAIDEAAATGMLRQPGFLTKGLGDIDARRGNTLRDLFLGLEGQRAESKLNLENTLADRAERALNNQRTFNLSRAGLNQAGNQFQSGLGFERDRFSEGKRRSAIDDIFGERSLDAAERVGRMQAEAAKPTFIDQFAKITGGLGGLAGGIGSLTRPRARTAGVY